MTQPDDDKPDEVYDSMKAAAAGMGCSIGVIRIAKNRGCPAFKGSRIYGSDFQKWLEENPDALTENESAEKVQLNSLEKQLLEQQIRRARESADGAALENQKRRGELIERSDLEFAIPICLKEALRIQRQYLPADVYNIICKETKKGFGKILSAAIKMSGEEITE